MDKTRQAKEVKERPFAEHCDLRELETTGYAKRHQWQGIVLEVRKEKGIHTCSRPSFYPMRKYPLLCYKSIYTVIQHIHTRSPYASTLVGILTCPFLRSW